MFLRRIGWVAGMIFLVGSHGVSLPAHGSTPLTEEEVERFVGSFMSVTVMASEYWGERRYTKKGKILPPKGSYERALKEMKAAGKLGDFEKLLTSHGFDDLAAWKKMKDRFAIAQRNIVMEQRGNSDARERILKRRRGLEKYIAKVKENKENLPPEAVQSRIRSFEDVLEDMDKELVSFEDTDAVRPYMELFATIYAETKERTKAKERSKVGFFESTNRSIAKFVDWIIERVFPGKTQESTRKP